MNLNLLEVGKLKIRRRQTLRDRNGSKSGDFAQRGDDIFVATEIRYDKLFNTSKNEITSFGKEMKLLMDKGYKPRNLTVTEWEDAKVLINQLFK